MTEPDFVQQKRSGKPVPKILKRLVFEVVKGKPIYYKGYRDVLNKTKTLEESKLETQLQTGLKARIAASIGLTLLNSSFQIAVGKLGLILSKHDQRAADVAIFKAENWRWEPKFSNLPPEVIIEIDVQAELEDMTEMEYVKGKIKDYHAFGVQKVIWIFTKEKLVFVATEQLPWLAYDWSAEVEVVDGVQIRLEDLVK